MVRINALPLSPRVSEPIFKHIFRGSVFGTENLYCFLTGFPAVNRSKEGGELPSGKLAPYQFFRGLNMPSWPSRVPLSRQNAQGVLIFDHGPNMPFSPPPKLAHGLDKPLGRGQVPLVCVRVCVWSNHPSFASLPRISRSTPPSSFSSACPALAPLPRDHTRRCLSPRTRPLARRTPPAPCPGPCPRCPSFAIGNWRAFTHVTETRKSTHTHTHSVETRSAREMMSSVAQTVGFFNAAVARFSFAFVSQKESPV